MTTHSSILAWRIPWREKPGSFLRTYVLQNIGSQGVGHNLRDLAHRHEGPQGCILSLCLFNLYANYIMRNAGLEEAQAGIKIARRNFNNLRYTDDTTLVAESEEELKSLLKVKEESEKVGIKLNIQKTKIMASVPPLHGK